MSKSSARWLFSIPLVLFLGMSAFLYKGLFSDPTIRESAVLNTEFPAFDLPDMMEDGKRHNADTLIGKPFLVNVWGIWCPTCNAELGYLTQLREQGIDIVGLYYVEDYDADFGEFFDLEAERQGVIQKLTERGNPYQFNILDETRDLSLDLGVTGAPETFLVDKNGVIRLHHIGDINPYVWETKFAALWQELSQS